MLERYLDAEVELDKSPKIEGFTQGAKAAVVAAPIGAAIQALRGKSPAVGAIASGLAVGMVAGLAAASVQKYKNMQAESQMKYHIQNVMDRNPTMFQQPQFSQGFENVRYPY